jgi:hypothetical protein
MAGITLVKGDTSALDRAWMNLPDGSTRQVASWAPKAALMTSHAETRSARQPNSVRTEPDPRRPGQQAGSSYG